MRTYSMSRRLVMSAATMVAVTSSSAAMAQGLALNRFEPAPAGDRMFGVPSPYVAGESDLHVMGLFDYARNPLVLRQESSGDSVGSVVSNQLFFHVDATLALWNRLAVNVDLPLALAQTGDNPSDGTTAFASPDGAELGDLRVGARARLYGEYTDIFQLGLAANVWLPTGASGSFVSDGSVRFMPQLVLGGRGERLVWSAALGPDIRSSQDYGTIAQGTMFSGGAGVGFLVDDARNLQIGPELTVSTVLDDPGSRNTNAELLLGAKYRFLEDFEAGLAAGPGLSSGIGTPSFRAVAMLAYTPNQKPKPTDRDKDGIFDEADACIDVFGIASTDPKLHGCPSDRDKDGIVDDKDACPDVAGVATDDPATNGCPSDRDKDGILDVVDACPDVPGVASDDLAKNGCPLPEDKDKDGILDEKDVCIDIPGVPTSDPATNGCPPDTDGDGIRDDKDACPAEKGKPNEDPTKNGCPVAVRVTAGEIVILQQVQFDNAKATIRKESDDLLTEVAGVLKEHPEITGIEVQGHTDSKGSRPLNTKLSKDRANSVKKALVARGIDAARLTTQGYGPDVPIADNGTDEGRQKNRRVQFKIMSKAAPKQP